MRSHDSRGHSRKPRIGPGRTAESEATQRAQTPRCCFHALAAALFAVRHPLLSCLPAVNTLPLLRLLRHWEPVLTLPATCLFRSKAVPAGKQPSSRRLLYTDALFSASSALSQRPSGRETPRRACLGYCYLHASCNGFIPLVKCFPLIGIP